MKTRQYFDIRDKDDIKYPEKLIYDQLSVRHHISDLLSKNPKDFDSYDSDIDGLITHVSNRDYTHRRQGAILELKDILKILI